MFFIDSFLYFVSGKTFVLLFKSVTPEDMGEIKFTAEKASSTAKLKVKGKHFFVLRAENSITFHT